MAVGSEASAAGYPLVPDTGEEGRARWGAREINRTRDFVAQVKTSVSGPVSGRPWTIQSSTVGDPVGDGIIVISYGVTFSTPPWPVACCGSGPILVVITANNTVGFNAFLYDMSGNLITTAGLRRVNWTVTGIIA